jgi:hypothetical protein
MKVSITAVSYNERLDIIKRCLDSILCSRDVEAQITIIDNAGNSKLKSLLKHYPDIEYIEASQNLGFAKAVNIGLSKALHDTHLLLNLDTFFDSDALGMALKRFEEDDTAGIASVRFTYPNGSPQESIRRFPALRDQLAILFKLPHLLKLKCMDRYMMRDVDSTVSRLEVDSIMGAFMLIKQSVVDRIGYFDTRFFMWYEEVEYCKRAHDADFSIVHYGDIVIRHEKGVSFTAIGTLRKQLWTYCGMMRYFLRHGSAVDAVMLVVAFIPFVLIAGIISLIKHR